MPRTASSSTRAFAEERDADVSKLITVRDVLEFATYQGARVCGLEDRTGSLTPGKQADIVLITADEINLFPVIDPVSNVVLQADTSNVDAAMVTGRFLKRDGKLLAGDLRSARDEIAASLEYLISKVDKQPHWARRARRLVTRPDLAVRRAAGRPISAFAYRAKR